MYWEELFCRFSFDTCISHHVTVRFWVNSLYFNPNKVNIFLVFFCEGGPRLLFGFTVNIKVMSLHQKLLWTEFSNNNTLFQLVIILKLIAIMWLFLPKIKIMMIFNCRSKVMLSLNLLSLFDNFVGLAHKACVSYFHQIFIFSPNDSPSKTMKNAFHFI